MFYVYVLKNRTSGKIYIGQTSDLIKRLARNNGELPAKARSYTRLNKGFWDIAYKEERVTREEAMKRETYLKSHVGRDWLRTIMGPLAQW